MRSDRSASATTRRQLLSRAKPSTARSPSSPTAPIRTFRVEVTLPNADAKLRDGVSADIHIPVRQVKAQHISPGIMVLNDAGIPGVRVVVDQRVRFIPVTVLSDGPDGAWVAGLP